MSENFETGLNELYTRAAAAHSAGTGFPTTGMVATARRNRGVRAAAVSVVTVAAVVGVGFGGAAAIRTFGDGAPVGPAASNTLSPTAGHTFTVLTCGAAIADVPVTEPAPMTIEATLETPTVTGVGPLRGTVVITGAGASALTDESTFALQYLMVQDGVVVGIGRDTGDAPVVGLSGRDGVAHEFAVDWTGCDEDGQTIADLPAGEYELYAGIDTRNSVVTSTDELAVTDVVVMDSFFLGGPWPFTITARDATPPTATPDAETETGTPQPPESHGVDGVSALFTEGEPLADGEYVGLLQGVDAAAGTVDVDLAVMYGGQAAIDYVAANVPGGEVMDDYYLANDTATITTLPITADAPVWEWCFGTTEANALTYYQRTVAEWAVAPTDIVGETPSWQCADEAKLQRGTLYWFEVQGGVVVTVTGQYVP